MAVLTPSTPLSLVRVWVMLMLVTLGVKAFSFEKISVPEFYGNEQCPTVFFTMTSHQRFVWAGGTTWSKNLIEGSGAGCYGDFYKKAIIVSRATDVSD